MKRLILLLGSFAFATVNAAESIDERQDADSDGDVEVSNVAGEVRITGWDEDAIEITGELGNGIERLDFIRNGRHTKIKVIYQKGSHRGQYANLFIRLPEASELEVNTVSADIEVEGVQGLQHLRSVSGHITSQVFEDDFEAKTVSGNVAVVGRNARTELTLATVSGHIVVEDVSGEVEGKTVSGRIEVIAGVLSRARLKSTNGRLSLESALEAGGRYDLSVVNGNVDVLLEDDIDLDVNVETFNGNIANCFGEQSERKSKYGPGRFLRFSRGDGDRDERRSVRIRSLNGNVDVCSRNTSK